VGLVDGECMTDLDAEWLLLSRVDSILCSR